MHLDSENNDTKVMIKFLGHFKIYLYLVLEKFNPTTVWHDVLNKCIL
jgi:hypothetical protein